MGLLFSDARKRGMHPSRNPWEKERGEGRDRDNSGKLGHPRMLRSTQIIPCFRKGKVPAKSPSLSLAEHRISEGRKHFWTSRKASQRRKLSVHPAAATVFPRHSTPLRPSQPFRTIRTDRFRRQKVCFSSPGRESGGTVHTVRERVLSWIFRAHPSSPSLFRFPLKSFLTVQKNRIRNTQNHPRHGKGTKPALPGNQSRSRPQPGPRLVFPEDFSFPNCALCQENLEGKPAEEQIVAFGRRWCEQHFRCVSCRVYLDPTHAEPESVYPVNPPSILFRSFSRTSFIAFGPSDVHFPIPWFLSSFFGMMGWSFFALFR